MTGTSSIQPNGQAASQDESSAVTHYRQRPAGVVYSNFTYGVLDASSLMSGERVSRIHEDEVFKPLQMNRRHAYLSELAATQ